MHGKGHLPCHQAPADPAHPHESSGHPCAATGSAVSAPGCGHVHELPSTTIAPATLPVPTGLAFRAVERRAPASPGASRARGDEPPATPPPITFA